jgi:hypothetical protein
MPAPKAMKARIHSRRVGRRVMPMMPRGVCEGPLLR